MSDILEITYLFDPLCGWCYGAAPAVKRLRATPGITVTAAPTGLFSGDGARPMDASFAAYAWSNDERIARLTGQRFTATYRDHVLNDAGKPLDSGPATLALTAVFLTEPSREIEALAAIQAARYVDGLDITSLSVLAAILQGVGLGDAATRLAAPNAELFAANRTRTAQAQTAMRAFGVQGVPALLLTDAGGRRQMLPNTILFGGLDAFLAQLPPA
ncbi:protein-disulfide isomerase [Elstera litoralis]|uniref:Protein-disulfide isomerase n=1 Tax=Elstera litoralis TaxID=552518 RepID=A0A0F3IRV4_9PROT|nr:DsbA family protein [Elstera litoralis]KJV09352.1 protein-disulfide isomerase [Elstera litoralis]